MTLETQLAHAQAVLANGKRIAELAEERKQLTDGLAAVDEELQQLLAIEQMELPLAPARAKQKCSVCGMEGHTKRTCQQKGTANG